MLCSPEGLEKFELVKQFAPKGFWEPSEMAPYLSKHEIRDVAFCRSELYIGMPYKKGLKNILYACVAAPYISPEGQFIDDPYKIGKLLTEQDANQAKKCGIMVTGAAMLKVSCPEIDLHRGKINPFRIPELPEYSLMRLLFSQQVFELAEKAVDVILPVNRGFEIMTMDVVVNYLLGLRKCGFEIRTFDNRLSVPTSDVGR